MEIYKFYDRANNYQLKKTKKKLKIEKIVRNRSK